MNCRYCGTELPDYALFCSECGQAVAIDEHERVGAVASVSSSGSGSAAGFSILDLAFSSPGEVSAPELVDERELPDGTSLRPSHSADPPRCPQCGEPMADGDVFCGECGFVLRTVAPAAADGPADPDAETDAAQEAAGVAYDASAEPATAIIVLPHLIKLDTVEPAAEDPSDVAADESEAAAAEPSDPRTAATTEVEPLPGDLAAADLAEAEPLIDDLVLEPAAFASAPAPVVDPDLEFDEPLPFGLPAVKSAPVTRARPIPDPFPWGADQSLREDLEATRLVSDRDSGNRYVLQFSTGESVTVLGSGLVGRNPSLQPGEYVDQLVPIFDAGKSVSKTHLEFGQEAGRFWVSDRYSTNGSVIRQPESEPRRCDPGRRYFISRGTRVDVGEQFFVVS